MHMSAVFDFLEQFLPRLTCYVSVGCKTICWALLVFSLLA